MSAEAPARKHSAAAAKVTKRVRKPVKALPESSSEEVLPKKASTEDRIPRDAQDVLDVVQGMSILRGRRFRLLTCLQIT
jgi:hypothetical protein